MKIIGLAGLARSGKDTVADYIETKYGYKKFVLSDVLKDALKTEGKEPTKENMADLGNTLRKKSGKDIVAKMLYERCQNQKRITIVGFRSPEEVEFFRKKTKDFTLIEVRAPQNTRIRRSSEQDISEETRTTSQKKALNKSSRWRKLRSATTQPSKPCTKKLKK